MTEQARFDRCLGAVLRLEGGYVDDPGDPGGPTNLGVTQAVLSEALGRPASVEAVRALTPDAVAPLYRLRYWRAAGCDGMEAGPDLVAFDTAVNMGPGTAVRLLQQALGLQSDGVAGPRTLAMAAAANPAALVEDLCRLRAERYRALAGFGRFGAGWLKRVQTVRALALTWAEEAQARPLYATETHA
jgi:lysozyme family protein